MKKYILSVLLVASALVLVSCGGGKNNKRKSTPELTGVKENVKIAIGDSYNPLEGVKATDDRGKKDLTDKIKSTFNAEWLEVDKPYSYTFTLSVVNEHGNFARATINLQVGEPTVEFKHLRAFQNYYLDSREYAPIEGIQAFDVTDISNQVELTDEITYNNDAWKHAELKAGETKDVEVSVETDKGGAKAVISIDVYAEYNVLHEIPNGTEVLIWHANGSDITDLLKTQVGIFEKKYPNIKINLAESKGNYDTIREDMNNAIKGGTPPNIVQGYPDHMAEYLSYNALEPLSPYMFDKQLGFEHGANAVETFADIVGPYVVENASISMNGEFYSMPYNKSTEVMIFNMDYVTKVWADANSGFAKGVFPETWTDMMKFAEQVNKHSNTLLDGYNAKRETPWADAVLKDYKTNFRALAYDSVDNMAITTLRQWGGEYTARNSNGTGRILFDNSKESMEVLEFFNKNNKNMTIPAFYSGANYSSDMFKAGRIAATIGSSGGARHNTPEFDKNGDPMFEYVVKPIPYNDETNRNDVIQQGTNFGVVRMDATDAQKAASWLFIKHLMSAEAQIPFTQGTGYTPVRNSILDNELMNGFVEGEKETMGANKGKDLDGARLMNARAIKASYEQVANQFTDVAFVGSALIRGYWGTAMSQSVLLPTYNQTSIKGFFDRAVANSKRILG